MQTLRKNKFFSIMRTYWKQKIGFAKAGQSQDLLRLRMICIQPECTNRPQAMIDYTKHLYDIEEHNILFKRIFCKSLISFSSEKCLYLYLQFILFYKILRYILIDSHIYLCPREHLLPSCPVCLSSR